MRSTDIVRNFVNINSQSYGLFPCFTRNRISSDGYYFVIQTAILDKSPKNINYRIRFYSTLNHSHCGVWNDFQNPVFNFN